MRQSGQVWENVLLVVIAWTCLHRAVRCELAVTPWEQSAQLGSDAKFVCSDDGNETKAVLLKWSFVVASDNNNNSVPINMSGRVRAENGTLTLSNLTYGDAGTYRCDNPAGSEPAKGVLIVYVMPDYLKEGLIIAGIAVALMIIVLIGAAILFAGQRERKKIRMSEQEKRLLKRTNNSHKTP